MQKLSLTAAATILGLLCAAAPAIAATPFTAGQGSGARMVADPDGAGHVVWGIPSRGGAPAKIGYCRVPVGGSACDVTKEFAFPVAAGQTAQTDPADVVVFAPRAMEIIIIGSCTGCSDGAPEEHAIRWVSTTSGESFSEPLQIGTTPSGANMTSGGYWISAVNLFMAPSEAATAMTFSNPPGPATRLDPALLGPGYAKTPSIVQVPVAGETAQMVFAASDGGAIQYSVFTASLSGTSVADRNNWSFAPRNLSAPAPDSADPQLSSGPTSTYLTYRRLVAGDNQILLRRFNSELTTRAFGPATQIQGADAIDNSADGPDSTQDVSGRVHVVWSSQHDGGRLRYTLSDVSGATFTAPVSIARGESFGDPDVAAAPNGTGWAAWSTGGDSPIRVVRLEAISDAAPVTPPVVTPPPTTKPPAPKPLTKTVSVKGASITFGVPRTCIKRGSTFKATLTWKKKKRKGNLFVKVAKVDFYIGKKIVKTDRTAPFTQTLKVVATTAAGSKLTVRARAHIKVRRGKSPKKSITSAITICP